MSTSAELNEREEGLVFLPKFDASGLVTCVATDAATGDVLMVAHMNDEALRKTIASGEAWYFSRSRNALWRKGRTADGLRSGRHLDSRRTVGRGVPYRTALLFLSHGKIRGR